MLCVTTIVKHCLVIVLITISIFGNRLISQNSEYISWKKLNSYSLSDLLARSRTDTATYEYNIYSNIVLDRYACLFSIFGLRRIDWGKVGHILSVIMNTFDCRTK